MSGTSDVRGMALHLCAKAQILFQGLRYASILPHLEIEGRLTIEAAIQLFDLAQDLPPRDAVVVELGCGKGKASMVLAKALEAQASHTLYCVHSQQISPPHDFLENLRSSGGLGAIKNLSGEPRALAKSFGRSIDLLVMGPEADYSSLLENFRAWAPMLSYGGKVVFRDLDDCLDGPARVIDQELGDREIWAEGELVGGMYVTHKLGAPSLSIALS